MDYWVNGECPHCNGKVDVDHFVNYEESYPEAWRVFPSEVLTCPHCDEQFEATRDFDGRYEITGKV